MEIVNLLYSTAVTLIGFTIIAVCIMWALMCVRAVVVVYRRAVVELMQDVSSKRQETLPLLSRKVD